MSVCLSGQIGVSLIDCTPCVKKHYLLIPALISQPVDYDYSAINLCLAVLAEQYSRSDICRGKCEPTLWLTELVLLKTWKGHQSPLFFKIKFYLISV